MEKPDLSLVQRRPLTPARTNAGSSLREGA
jgi:hypothetical protein